MGIRRTLGREAGRDQVAVDALAALRVGVVVLNSDDVPVIANAAALELGLVRDGWQTVHAIIRTLAGQVRVTGIAREVELDLPRRARRTGESIGVHVRVVPLAGGEYPPGHVAIEATDVTEARRLERVRRDFVANVSHELKTPVGALALLAETLTEAADDPEATRRFAGRIQHESQRLARLVKELLELSRLQGAEPLPTPARVAVDRIIAEAVDRTRTNATMKRITVETVGELGLTVYGDENQLATAVGNLAENAIAYSPEETTVTIRARRAGDWVEIAVVDQGIGIPDKDLGRIFERFYRTDHARSRDTGGTGLGLAIVKHIAVNHGGRVEVASTLGQGSTFTLILDGRDPRGRDE